MREFGHKTGVVLLEQIAANFVDHLVVLEPLHLVEIELISFVAEKDSVIVDTPPLGVELVSHVFEEGPIDISKVIHLLQANEVGIRIPDFRHNAC